MKCLILILETRILFVIIIPGSCVHNATNNRSNNLKSNLVKITLYHSFSDQTKSNDVPTYSQ